MALAPALIYLAGAIFAGLVALTPVVAWDISAFQILHQDGFVLTAAAVLLFALVWRTPPAVLPSTEGRERTFAIATALVVAIIGYGGAHLVALSFPLSMDEFMALFDAEIFRTGHLRAPLPPEWQGFAPALQLSFLLTAENGASWSSSYLPVNAVLHALGGFVGDPALTAPLLAACAVLALYGAARRLWPARLDAAIVAVALLATSSQFVITAMTPYAMTAHLALNLVWLWLFLGNNRWSHAGALAVALAATGLHQLIFHPLFAAPFVLGLWIERRYRLAAVYTCVYAAICLFWMSYWTLTLPVAAAVDAEGLRAFLARGLGMLSADLAMIVLMTRNLFRFISWQNPFTLVLFMAALGSVRRWQSPLPQLLGGVLLTLFAVAVLLPFQGHGWGYRYLHGLLGNLSLIAAYGWIALVDGERIRMRGAFAACTLFALLLLPVRAWQMHSFIRPYADAERAIQTADADIVIVDPSDAWYARDLVRNDPFLAHTPKVLALNALSEDNIATLCARGRVAVFDRADAARFGVRVLPLGTDARPQNAELRSAMARQGCGTAKLGTAR